MRREERPVVIGLDASGLALEGLFVPGAARDAGGGVVAPPHPLYGGSMDSPVVNEIAHAFTREGLASLRFNWRGVGASGGTTSGAAGDADADYAAALAELAGTVGGPIAAAGYSFGAAAALRAASRDPRVERLVLVAPPPSMLDAEALRRFAGPLLVVAAEADRIAPAAELEALFADRVDTAFALIEEADHFFQQGLATIGRRVSGWLASLAPRDDERVLD